MIIVKTEVGRTGIITATDENGVQTQILLDDRGYVHRVRTATFMVHAGCGEDHQVEVVMEHPPDFPKMPLALRVLVDP